MNKKIIGTVAIATALLTGYNVYESKSEMKLSELALANIEALAGCESPVEDRYGITATMTCPMPDGGNFTHPACDFDDNYRPTKCNGRSVR